MNVKSKNKIMCLFAVIVIVSAGFEVGILTDFHPEQQKLNQKDVAQNKEKSSLRFTDENDPPSINEYEFLLMQETIFETLFNQPWTQSDITYSLTTRIEGTGEYHGVNRYGTSYLLTVRYVYPIDLNGLNLPPEQLQQLQAQQLEVGMVAGVISTDIASIPILGISISGVTENQFFSQFIITNIIDLDSGWFQDIFVNSHKPTVIEVMKNPLSKSDAGLLFSTPKKPSKKTPKPPKSPTVDPCDACWGDYYDRVADANNQLGVDEYNAWNEFYDREDSARKTRDSAKQAAARTAAAQMELAFNSFFCTMIGCVATAVFNQLAGTICGLVALATLASALAIISANLNTACANADAAYQNSVDEAAFDRDRKIWEAEQRHYNVLNALADALEDCLSSHRCPCEHCAPRPQQHLTVPPDGIIL